MKYKELTAKNTEELHKELHALLKEQFNLRMQKGMGENPRPHNSKVVRRNIARVKTILSEKAASHE